MAFGIILVIIFVGLLLIFVEMLLAPGTHLFAILGGLAIVTGVILMYMYYGSKWGNIMAVTSFTGFLLAITLGFRVIQSNRMAMKAEIKSKVNEIEKHLYNVGDKGIAASELRPNGKAVFNGSKVEVFSTGEYIHRDSQVEIVKVTGDRIFVKLLKT